MMVLAVHGRALSDILVLMKETRPRDSGLPADCYELPKSL